MCAARIAVLCSEGAQVFRVAKEPADAQFYPHWNPFPGQILQPPLGSGCACVTILAGIVLALTL
jgi:hypothetical protein